jgi:nucleoside-diphosphate-sugar epimerase
MGYDRIAGKYRTQKVLLNVSTNYVHRDDVVAIIELCIERNIVGEVFDMVAPLQCNKKVLFRQNEKQFGFEKMEFIQSDEVQITLSSSVLCKVLGYRFIKEDVCLFWDEM